MVQRILFFVGLALAVPSSPVRAEVIIGNFGGSGNAQSVALYNTSWGAFGFEIGSQAYTLDSVDLRLDYGPSTPLLQLRSDNGADKPSSTVLANFTSPATQGNGTVASYNFLPTSTPILTANTKYWFVLSSSGTDFSTASFWHSLSTSNVDPSGAGATAFGYATSNNSGGSWSYVTSPTLHPAIQVNGTQVSAVPEPTSFLLVAGLAAAGGLRRRFPRR